MSCPHGAGTQSRCSYALRAQRTPRKVDVPITIGANIASLRTQRQLGQTTDALARAYERLSSGQRINHASDDAAGLSIASQLTAGARVLNQAVRNLNDGISLTSIAEGALSSLSGITVRQMELAEQAANGTYSGVQRAALQKESSELTKEFNRIVESAEFNGRQVFDLNTGDVAVQAGYGASGALSIDLTSQLKRLVGSGTFTELASYNLNSASGVVTGDFNGDGIPDFATIGGNVSIAIGNGDGTFGGETTYATGGHTRRTATADLNGDGYRDILAVGDAGVSVFLNNRSGSFSPRTNYVLGGSDVAAADFDGDGDVDVAGAAWSGPLTIKMNDGAGVFGVSTTYASAGTQVFRIKAGDLDGDGRPDIVGTDSTNSLISVWINNGNGTFKTAVSYASGAGTSTPELADFNGDGKLDLASVDASAGRLSVRFNNGDGTFGARASYDTAGTMTDLVSGDFNADGRPDIAVTALSQSVVSVLLNDGNGAFGAAVTYNFNTTGQGMDAADLNNDGALDIGTAEFGMRFRLGNGVGTFYDPRGDKQEIIQLSFGDGRGRVAVQQLDLSTQAAAQSAVTGLERRMDRLTAESGSLGAAERRLQFAAQTLRDSADTSMAAASRITSADVAEETANVLRRQILQKTAQAILAQANQQSELVLRLLEPPA